MLASFAAEPSTFSLSAIEAVWDVTDGKPTVRQLVDRGLLEPVGDARFRMHALLLHHASVLLELEP